MLAAVGRLEGKVALITGAASGMGMVAAELFADEGARVMLSDVADEAGETVAKEIEAAGHEAAYVHADVSSEADARAMVEATVERFGGLHVLYNNAGVMLAEDGSVDATDEAVWDRTLAINVKGVAHGCKHGIPAMIDSGGGPRPVLPVRWDFSLPLYVLLSLVLVIAIARFRLTPWTALACFAAAAVWRWTADAFGVVTAASLAIFVAAVLGTVRNRRGPAEDR